MERFEAKRFVQAATLQIDRVLAEEGPALLRVEGELDLEHAPQLRACLDELVGQRRSLVLDLRGLTFMDSSGLAILLGARQRAIACGGTFEVTGATGAVRTLLEGTGLLSILTSTSSQA